MRKLLLLAAVLAVSAVAGAPAFAEDQSAAPTAESKAAPAEAPAAAPAGSAEGGAAPAAESKAIPPDSEWVHPTK